MLAQFYSTLELDVEVRRTFKLPSDPYTDAAGVEYLRDLGVIFYRDEIHSEGVIIQPKDKEEPIEETGGFLTHYYEVEMDSEGSPVPWNKPSKEIIQKNGDDLAWIKFNQQRIVERFNSAVVHHV